MLSTLVDWLGVADAHHAAILVGAALVGGLVRGFVGFGSGMIFVPVAAAVVGPAAAAGLIWTIDAPITLRYSLDALRGCRWSEVLPLLAGALTGLPIGLQLLIGVDPVVVRWGTAVFIMASVAALASGWRYRGTPTLSMTFLVGFFSGVTTGVVGIGGPFIALFWLGGQDANEAVRRNLNAYFGLTTLTVGPAFVLKGIIDWTLIVQSLPLILIYTLTTVAGVWGYNRFGGKSYRPAALGIAGTAAVTSLPALDPWLR